MIDAEMLDRSLVSFDKTKKFGTAVLCDVGKEMVESLDGGLTSFHFVKHNTES